MAILPRCSCMILVFILYGSRAKSSDLGRRVADLESLVYGVGLAIDSNGDILYGLNNRVQLTGQEIAKGRLKFIIERRARDPNIGFDARLSTLGHYHLRAKQTIVFNHVQANQGAGYNATNGRFTCPSHGIYQFASTISSGSGKTVDCEMVLEGNQVAHFHANSKGFDQATHVLVLECDVGQQVWVRHLSGIHDSEVLGTRYSWASFSGHLVHTL